MVGRLYRGVALAMALVLSLGVAACGDDDEETESGTTETTEEGGGGTGGGDSFTIGFTNPLGSNDQLSVLQRAIEARAECLGGEVVALDSNLDVDKQISDMDQLISQDVDGIIVFPLDANAIEPAVERAAEADITTIGINVTLDNPDATDVSPFEASVNQGTEQMATETAEYVAEQLGGSRNVLGVGIGIPVPVI